MDTSRPTHARLIVGIAFCLIALLAVVSIAGCSGESSSGSSANDGTEEGTMTTDSTTSSSEKPYDIVDAAYIEDHKGEFTLVDVRSANEYDEGHIPDAINIVYMDDPQDADSVVEDVPATYEEQGLAPDDPIVLYCKSGVRAGKVADLLTQMGYTNISVYEGSWDDWSSDDERPVSYD